MNGLWPGRLHNNVYYIDLWLIDKSNNKYIDIFFFIYIHVKTNQGSIIVNLPSHANFNPILPYLFCYIYIFFFGGREGGILYELFENNILLTFHLPSYYHSSMDTFPRFRERLYPNFTLIINIFKIRTGLVGINNMSKHMRKSFK